MMRNDKLKELKALYAIQSKHSNYQILPKRLYELIGESNIEVKTRFEEERLSYILENVDIKGKTILDIGGNTGYFTFEFLDRGAKFVHYYEGNKIHADFVKIASDVLDLERQIKITNNYFTFQNEITENYDVILLLNVLHHLGDDYGSKNISVQMAKKEMAIQLNNLADKTKILVLQIGFNWKGDRNSCLFTDGTKSEMISFITEQTNDNWSIHKIGIPELINQNIHFCDKNTVNIDRNNSLGEFLNRPIFILKSRK